MRTLFLVLAAILVSAPLASAQDATILTAACEPLADNAVIVFAVPTESLPEGFVDDLPAIPEGAEQVSVMETSLAYALPSETVASASEKDEGLGLIFSILLTGGGHIYAGETSKGLTLLAIGVGAYVGGVAVAVATDSVAPIYLGALVSLGAWIYGISDAQAAVRRQNALNGFALAPAAIDGGTQTGYGLSLRTRF